MASKNTSTPKKSAPRKAKTVRQEAPAPRPAKPVFRAGTWVSILLLAAAIGGAIYLNKSKEAAANTEATATTDGPTYIISADSSISSIEVKPADGETVKVARNKDGVWAVELPFETEADQGMVEAAASQVTALKILNQVDADPSIFGFNAPAYTITIGLAGGKTSTLEIGDSTPTNSGYYVRVDKKKMVIVGLSSIDALTSLSVAPPYLNTPTPTALPATPTPETAPEASATPTP